MGVSPLRREFRALIRIALPAAATQLGLMLMGTVDTIMLGHYSATALAAGALGHSISVGVIVLGQGLLMAVDALVSQAWGAGDRRRVRKEVHNAVIIALVLSLPMSLVLWWIRPILEVFRQQPSIVGPAVAYIRTVIIGVPAFLLFVALRRSLQAMSIVWPALMALLIANLVNAGTNYLFVFGHYGMPELGVRGAAYATSFSRWAMLLVFLWLARPALAPLHLARSWRWPGRRALRVFLRVGMPIAAHSGVEFWMITTVALMMGSLSAEALAAHQIALVLAALPFMITLGISGAASARVGQAIGAGDLPRARIAAALSMAFGIGVMLLSATLFWLAPGMLARLFIGDQQVLAIAVLLIPIAALFQIFDGVQAVAAGALRGLGDTRFPAMLAVLCYWGLCIPLAYFLTFHTSVGVQGPWWGLAAGLSVAGILLSWRLVFKLGRGVEALVSVAP
jgi:MATE family multidrug resistance protein